MFKKKYVAHLRKKDRALTVKPKDGMSDPRTIFDYEYKLSKLEGLEPEILDPNKFNLIRAG